MLRSFLVAAFWTISVATAGAADLAELRVSPPDVNLATALDRQGIVVQAVFTDGITRDVTDQSTWTLANPALVRREGNTLHPAADGQTELKIEFGGQALTLPVKVENSTVTRPISFKLDVMPVFMKAGCNTGSCHGAARGKDGFRLSLFGYDPNGDHNRITREFPGRRVDLAIPEASMMVEKCVGDVPHTGGKRYEKDSELNQQIVKWIAAGTPLDPADIPTCSGITIYPRNGVLDGPGDTQRVTVRATYSDGSDRDVTHLALFLTNNENSAAINPAGIITAGARGEAFVMARFSTYTVGSQYIVLPKALQYEELAPDPVNYIDEFVASKLKKLRIHPSGLCSDEEFLRRVSIDLTGLLPTRDEYAGFMADADPKKREKKIDELLGRKEFTEMWVSKWAEWLMIRTTQQVSTKSVVLYYQWLVDQISNNVPLDKMVQDLLSASGGTFKVPQTNYYQMEQDRLKISENTAQIFMGMRIQCAQCHNHPFDRWTQDDYYNFAALFAQVGRKTSEDSREQIIFNAGGGEVQHPVTGANAIPTFLGGGPADLTGGLDRRVALGKWLASPKNPYFAQNFSNRIWHHFFGVGIVEPVDDVRVSNPASNPELLSEMAKRFTESNYNFKGMVRDICLSKAYQRSTQRNESNGSDELNFAHQTIRRIKAESMLDIISEVTTTKDKFAGLPLGSRAVQIANGSTSDYFLTTFGRATRETACSCEVKMEPTLSQALHLMNGDVINTKMAQGGVIKSLQDKQLTPMQIVEQLYVTCLTRKPTEPEVAALAPLFAEGTDVNRSLDDVYWALLNSREFLFNH